MRYLTMFFAFALVMACFSVASPANAQTEDKREEARKALEDRINETPFPATKSGCARKAAFFHSISTAYEQGRTISELVQMKIMEPYVREVFDTIGKEGLVPARINNIERYRSCAKDAGPEHREEREIENTRIYKACEGINDVVLGTLKAINQGNPVASALNAYAGKKLDVEGMMLERTTDPAGFLVTHMYDTAEKESYGAAVEFGAAISLGCVARMR